jgi:hypothetical protein
MTLSFRWLADTDSYNRGIVHPFMLIQVVTNESRSFVPLLQRCRFYRNAGCIPIHYPLPAQIQGMALTLHGLLRH